MKKPLLNRFERYVILETKTFYRDRLLLYLAIKHFKRKLDNKIIVPLKEYLIKVLYLCTV